jgi:putative transcriptional regulator
MTLTHHPGEELLLDYASGSQGEAWGLAIATHLALCPQCRGTVAQFEAMGGGMIEDIVPDEMASGAFESLMASLEAGPEQEAIDAAPVRRTVAPTARTPLAPEPLRSYLNGDLDELPWRRFGIGASQKLIDTGDGAATARLLRIPAGQPVPVHSHGGLELTLVLAGGFSDATGHYIRGDLQIADEALQHQPRADAGEDCICLAVTDAPLRFKSFAARLVQPLIGI